MAHNKPNLLNQHTSRTVPGPVEVMSIALGTRSATSLKFVYDGWNLIAVLDPQSTVLRSFTWGLDLSGSQQGAGGVGGLLAVSFPGTQGAPTTNCFVAFDGNGNVAALVNAADGKQVAQYEYGPFGELLRATGPMAKANPFRSHKEQIQSPMGPPITVLVCDEWEFPNGFNEGLSH